MSTGSKPLFDRPASGDSIMLQQARQLRTLYRDMEESGDSRFYAETLSIEEAIADTQASGLAEAAVQIMLVAGFVECLRDHDREDAENLLDMMERLSRSALTAVVAEAGIDLDRFAGQHYVPDRTDPFRKLHRQN